MSRSGLVASPMVLLVDDPVEIAALCWDAGFTVRVHESVSEGSTVIVTDPLGQRFVLAAREMVRADDPVHVAEAG